MAGTGERSAAWSQLFQRAGHFRPTTPRIVRSSRSRAWEKWLEVAAVTWKVPGHRRRNFAMHSSYRRHRHSSPRRIHPREIQSGWIGEFIDVVREMVVPTRIHRIVVGRRFEYAGSAVCNRAKGVIVDVQVL